MYVYYDPVTFEVTGSMITSHTPPQGSYIEIPDQELGELGGLSVIDGEVVSTSMTPYRSNLVHSINKMSGEVRSRFITDSVAQQMVYLGKRDEALAYLADPSPVMSNYPFLQAEIGITAPTAYELAQIWLNMQGIWLYVASSLEAMRISHIEQVQQAANRTEADAAVSSFSSGLSVFMV